MTTSGDSRPIDGTSEGKWLDLAEKYEFENRRNYKVRSLYMASKEEKEASQNETSNDQIIILETSDDEVGDNETVMGRNWRSPG